LFVPPHSWGSLLSYRTGESRKGRQKGEGETTRPLDGKKMVIREK